jgi:hypothetical protein
MGASTPFRLYGIRNWAFAHVLADCAGRCPVVHAGNMHAAGLKLGEKFGELIGARASKASADLFCDWL